MSYDSTADAIARNIWEVTTGNGRELDRDLWDQHRAICDAATCDTYAEGISVDEWRRRALAQIAGK